MTSPGFAAWWHGLTRWGSFGIMQHGPGTEKTGVQAPTIVLDGPDVRAIPLDDTVHNENTIRALLHKRQQRTIRAIVRVDAVGGVDRITVRTAHDGALLGHLPHEHVASFLEQVALAFHENDVPLDSHIWIGHATVELRGPDALTPTPTAWLWAPPPFLAHRPAA